jgi:hypothetical protein
MFRQPMRALRLPVLLIFLFYETSWQVYLAPTDVTRYQCYAMTFWFGSRAITRLPATQCAFLPGASPQPAFHLLPLEYPPLTILFFSLPLFVPLPYYSLAFALLMLLIVGIVHWLLNRFHSQQAAWRLLLYLGLGAGVLVQVRFDLLPAACMLLCLIAADRKRWGIAYSALAIGVLLKLYPLIALPALFIAEQHASSAPASYSIPGSAENSPWFRYPIRRYVPRWHWKHIGLFSGIVMGVSGCFALLNLQETLDGPVRYLIQRPTQIESLQGSLLWLAHDVGIPFQIVFSYGSLNIISPLASMLSWSGTGMCILGSLCIFRLQWRQRLSLGQAMIALLILLITTGKVFSPQYLIWVIPLVAYVGAARPWLYGWGLISLATTGIYIFYYSHLPNPDTAAQVIQSLPGFFEVVSLRNAAFCFLTLAYLFNWFQARHAHL